MPKIKFNELPKPIIEFYNKRTIPYGTSFFITVNDIIRVKYKDIVHEWRYSAIRSWQMIKETGDFNATNAELNSGWKQGYANTDSMKGWTKNDPGY